jgi:ribose-phosphate pyrophosphokinase
MNGQIIFVSPNFEDMLKPNIELKKFPDSDSYIRVPQIRECTGKDIVLFHRLYPEQDSALMQALFIFEALKSVRAESITLVAPYLPYSRQDKVFLKGEVKSADKICRLLADAGCTKLVTLDCHFLKKPGTFEYNGLKIVNVTMNEALLNYAKKKFDEPFEVISPDEGARYMVEEQGGQTMQKARGGYNEGEESKEVAYRGIERLERGFDVRGKNVLILDDMIATGSTMTKAVENVKAGGARRIACGATHGFFLKDSLAILRRECEFVFVTNSIPSPVSEINVVKDLQGHIG